MIKEGLKYLFNAGIKPNERAVDVIDQNGIERNFIIDDEGRPFEVRPHDSRAQRHMNLNALTSLVDYIKNIDSNNVNGNFFLHVEDELNVSLLGTLDKHGEREHLVSARAIVPHFQYEYFHSAEELIIALQSTFVKVGDRDLLLKVIGNVKEENVRNTGDDGMSQAVTIKTGVASANDVKVPNPVTLAPYRTFLEVEQPESEFVFRMKDGPSAAIFEADGGSWRNQAILNVRNYLMNELKEEVESGRITIIA